MLRESASLPALLLALMILSFSGSAAGSNMNRSITIGDGIEADGQSTVNGSISVGRAAIINGSLETVNGAITLDDNARARDVETVNGGIRLGSGVTVDDIGSVNGTVRVGENASIGGEISVVNGRINTDSGSRVTDDVSNVNGEIYIEGTEIGGDVSTVNGDVTLTGKSLLHGNLTIEKPGGFNWGSKSKRKPRVIIGPGAEIKGEIRLEREVELFISDKATVRGVSGEMTMNDAVRFSGEHP